MKAPPPPHGGLTTAHSHHICFPSFYQGRDCGLGVLNSPWPTETQAECIWNASLNLGNASWPRLNGLLWWLSGTESAYNARDTGDEGLIPGSGRSPGGGHGNPLQYSCPGKPVDRGAWWATVHRVTQLDMTENTHIPKIKGASRIRGMKTTQLNSASWDPRLRTDLCWFYLG